jgi:hypothetical protein
VYGGETPHVSVKIRDVEQNETCSMELKENSTTDCMALMPVYTRWINGSAIEITFLSESKYELSIGDGNLQSLRFHSCGFAINVNEHHSASVGSGGCCSFLLLSAALGLIFY